MKIAVNSIIGLFVLFGCTHVSKEEKTVSYSSDAQAQVTIEKNLSIIAKYQYSPDNNLDIVALSEKTANLLVESVNNEKKDLKQYKGLNNAVAYKNKLAIYSFRFDSGGTRGHVTYPIIQWKFRDGIKAGNISEFLNCNFEKITVLDSLKNLYLLTGHEKGDGSCDQSIVYVMSIHNNELDLQYKAFEGQSYLSLCNGNFIYDEAKKTLKFKLNNTSDKENLTDKIDTTTNIYNAIKSGYIKNGEFSLKFNGEDFK